MAPELPSTSPEGQPPLPSPAPSAAIVAGAAREGLARQLGELNALDTKAATLVGFVAVILGLLFTSDYVTHHWAIFLSIGTGILGASVFPLAVALWPSAANLAPSPASLVRLTHMPTYFVQQHIAREAAGSIEHNQQLVRRKRLTLGLATSMIAVAVAIVAATLVYALA